MSEDHQRILTRYAQYDHLPEPYQKISGPVCDLMHYMVDLCRANKDPDEITRGLHLLIQAKDCFVRAMLP